MGRVIHFELPIDNAERATNFYSGVFGWTIQKWEGPTDYWLIGTGEGQPGIDGAFTMRSGAMTHTTNTIEVTSLDDAVAKVRELGGTVLEARLTVPGIGYLAYCIDTEGNVFGMMQNDQSAQ